MPDITIFGTDPLDSGEGYSTENTNTALMVGTVIEISNPSGKQIKGVRIYIPSDSVASFTGAAAIVWRVSAATATVLAADQAFPGITVGQWNELEFNTPVDIDNVSPNDLWVIGVYLPHAGYSYKANAFTSEIVSPDDPDLVAVDTDDFGRGNGVFRPGALSVGSVPGNVYFGIDTFNATHYGVDVTVGIPGPPEPPVNTVAPVVAGTLTEGQAVTCTTGTWTGEPAPTYTRQWQHDTGSGFENIPGAVNSAYLLTEDDIGADIRCRVTGTNEHGNATATSNEIGPVIEAPPVPITNAEMFVAYDGQWVPLDLAGGAQDSVNRFYPEEYGAERDGVTDDTAAINDCITAAVAAGLADGTHYAEVHFSAGTYLLDADTTMGDDASLGNAQIPLPAIVPEEGQKFILKLRGANRSSTMHWAQTVSLGTLGTVLKSTLGDQSIDGTWGAPSVIGTPTAQVGGNGLAPYFSNMHVVIEGLCVMCPPNPSLIAIDLRGAAQASVLDASAMTDEVVADLIAGPPTNALGVGLYMPGAGNNAVSDLTSFTCMGYYYGLAIAEHLTAQRVLIVCCNTALFIAVGRLGVTTFHSGVIDYFCAEAVSRVIDLGDTPEDRRYGLTVSSLDTEIHDSGTHIYDPNNALRGEILWHDYQATKPRVNGAANVRIIDTPQARGAVTAPDVPATTVALANPYWRDAAVYVAGGTVTVIEVDGEATGVTEGMVLVPTGKAITLTYSSAPTWTWTLL